MSEAIEKDKIFLEIRQTIKFLLRERDQGKDNFEISDFFKPDLETEILNNFDNAISRKEYEETVLALFGAQGRRGNITLGAVRKEVNKLIRQYRMRSKKQILQKLIVQFQPVPSDVQLLKDYVAESYNRAMKEPLKLKIASYVKEGTTNLRNVMSILRREKYDIDQRFVKEILEKIIKDVERVRKRLQRGKTSRSSVKKFAMVKPAVASIKRLRDQMQKSLIRKTKNKKSRFIREKCPKFRFELTENIVEDNIRTLIYSGKKGTSEISVRTSLDKDKITDVEILCLKKGNKKPSVFSVEEFLMAIEKNQKDVFLQHWLKSANKQVKFTNVQELIWYLQSILNERFNLPEGVANYLDKRFVQHLIELDLNLTKYVIEKALENV